MEQHTGAKARERYVVVFDCESDSSFDSLPGSFAQEKLRYMQFTVVCAVALPSALIEQRATTEEIMARATRFSWWRDVAEEGNNPIVTLLTLFDGADAIVGYNCLGFDFPLIRRFYRQTSTHPNPVQRYLDHRCKTVDVMARVRDATGNYYKLDDLLKANGLETKSGNGLQAIRLWQDGKREELKSYCETDVAVTAQLALLERMLVGQNNSVPCHVFGVRPALAAMRAQGSIESDDEFIIV